jgi:hypothetical protein
MSIRVGDTGSAISSLKPNGYVCIRGERFDARSEVGVISAESSVVVIGGDHMGLVVRAASADSTAISGEIVCTSFNERIAAEADRVAAERRHQLLIHRRTGSSICLTVGAIAGAVGASARWEWLSGNVDAPLLVAGACSAADLLVGLIAFWLLDEVLGAIDTNFRRITIFSTCLLVVAIATVMALAVPSLGIVEGTILAAIVSVLLAAMPTGFLILTGMGDG